MQNDNPSSETLADGTHVDLADGGETVANTDALSLAELNQIFGTTFKDKDAALAAVKETKNYVGKKKEDVAAELAQSATGPTPNPELESKVQKLQNDLFFSNNPQFKEHRALIESLGNPAEVVERSDVKALLEKAKAADEAEQNKSVVHSSPRLAQASTGLDEAIKIANSRASGTDLSEHLAKTIREAQD